MKRTFDLKGAEIPRKTTLDEITYGGGRSAAAAESKSNERLVPIEPIRTALNNFFHPSIFHKSLENEAKVKSVRSQLSLKYIEATLTSVEGN